MSKTVRGLAERLVDVAVRLVEEHGWGAVTIRQVAQAADVSYGAPIARFGDEVGLLAAVAERGLRLLEHELATPTTDATPPRPSSALRASAVNSLGLRYVEFALTRRNLHRAMYHPDLWATAPARSPASPSIARRDARSREWRERAMAARNACFARFVSAVVQDQMAGAIAAGPPGEIARIVTALADGFLLQAAGTPMDRPADAIGRHLGLATRLFNRATAGIGQPS